MLLGWICTGKKRTVFCTNIKSIQSALSPMVSRPVLTGIIAGVIVAGAAITYAAYQMSNIPAAQAPAGQENENPTPGVFEDMLAYTEQPVQVNEQKGYSVTEIADGIYWLVGSGYQTMFLATGEGVIAIDAPQPIGEGYMQAIEETTDEPVTHVIYSHHHQDHTGAVGQIFPGNATYIAQKETADVLANASDPNRPVPEITFGEEFTLTVGNQTLELRHIGNYHSDGDIVIYSPERKVAMVVDLVRPGITPFRAFAVTPDIDQYIEAHDTLVKEFDFDVLVTGHTQQLATKDHVMTNKQFTLDVMENARQAMEMGGADPVQACVDLTIDQWQGRLGNLDEFMTEHCTAMVEHLSQ
jgi:glyoxylase-like metal-dependent hydrolase (beta-lactamase superfamily II)